MSSFLTSSRHSFTQTLLSKYSGDKMDPRMLPYDDEDEFPMVIFLCKQVKWWPRKRRHVGTCSIKCYSKMGSLHSTDIKLKQDKTGRKSGLVYS
jgi:hypothetical protein